MEIYIPPTQAAEGDQGAGGESYTVQPGDTLESIAAQFGVDLGALISANFPDGIPGQLVAGQELHIPLGDVATLLPYIVQADDTTNSIAAQFSIGVMDLVRANPQLLH